MQEPQAQADSRYRSQSMCTSARPFASLVPAVHDFCCATSFRSHCAQRTELSASVMTVGVRARGACLPDCLTLCTSAECWCLPLVLFLRLIPAGLLLLTVVVICLRMCAMASLAWHDSSDSKYKWSTSLDSQQHEFDFKTASPREVLSDINWRTELKALTRSEAGAEVREKQRYCATALFLSSGQLLHAHTISC